MSVLDFVSGFLPLTVLLLVGWTLVRLVGSRKDSTSGNPAVSVRRAVLYGLLFIAIMVAMQGVVTLAQQLIDRGEGTNSEIAGAAAFVIVGVPVSLLLLRVVVRRLRTDPDEPDSFAWTFYLNLMLLTTLVAAMVSTQTVLRGLFGGDGSIEFDLAGFVAAAVWASIWAGHWFVLRRVFGVGGDFHLSIGSIVGLIVLTVGAAGVIYVAADELYSLITDDVDRFRRGPEFGGWAATTIVGAVVWSWYWIARYRSSPRSLLWFVTVVPIGSLAGFVAAVVAFTSLIIVVAVSVLGDPKSSEATRHFDSLPGWSAALIVGFVTWWYHRAQLRERGSEPERNDAVRSYDYLISAAASVTAVLGVVLLTAEALSAGSTDPNRVIAGAAMVGVGMALWSWSWGALRAELAVHRLAELQSPLRRVYVFSVLGAAAAASLLAAVLVLAKGLEDLLDSNLSRWTVHDNRYAAAVLAAASGVAWFHGRIYRSERDDYEPGTASGEPEQQKRVILVTPDGVELARDLESTAGISAVVWHRNDDVHAPAIDLELLGRQIAAQPGADLVVLIGDDGPLIIPVDGEFVEQGFGDLRPCR